MDSSLSTTSFNFTKVTFKGTELSSLDAAGIKYNPTTGAFKFDPSSIELYQKLRSTESGDVVVSFRVTDGSLSDDGTVTFTVTGVNDEQVVSLNNGFERIGRWYGHHQQQFVASDGCGQFRERVGVYDNEPTHQWTSGLVIRSERSHHELYAIRGRFGIGDLRP